MGCHTWGYKKLKSCSKDEQEIFLKKLNEHVQKNEANNSFEEFYESVKETVDECIQSALIQGRDDLVESWKEYSREDVVKERWLEENKHISQFMDGITLDNVKTYCEIYDETADYEIIDNEVYIYRWFDVPFRVYGFPEDEFTDMCEMKEWLHNLCKQTNDLCYYHNDEMVQVTEDNWNEFSEYLDEFFATEGIDNLYFNFG